jgi:hypothetical protein
VNPFDKLRAGPFDGFDRLTAGRLRAGSFDGFDRLTAGRLRAGPFDGFDRITAGGLRVVVAGRFKARGSEIQPPAYYAAALRQEI